MSIPSIHIDAFPDYESMREQLLQLAAAAPEWLTVSSIGQSHEGRELLLATVGDTTTGNPAERPAFYIQGDIHALELSRIHCLYIISELLRKHEQNGLLSRCTFYVIPSVNPDNVERVVHAGIPSMRSALPRITNRPDTLYPEDIDGDGKILWMRQIHPAGNYAVDPKDSRLMVFRESGMAGPFYRLIPEGVIHHWTGGEDFFIAPGGDWNRSFASQWDCGLNAGGVLPMNEPELRAVAEFLDSVKTLCGAISLHVGGGCLVIPPNRAKMELRDTALFKQIGTDYTRTTGHAVRRSNALKTPPWSWEDPSADRPGTFVDYMFEAFGVPGLDLELDGLYESIGVSLEDVEAIQTYDEFNEIQRKAVAFYDAERAKNPSLVPIVEPWRPFDHPQLGPVEIGGVQNHVLYMRLLTELPAECARVASFLEQFANYTPRAALEDIRVERLTEGDSLYRISAVPVNAGRRPTSLTCHGSALWWKPAPRITLTPAEGVVIVEGTRSRVIGPLNATSAAPRASWIVRVESATPQRLGIVEWDCATGGVARTSVSLTGY